jgi:hypothetical protein
MKPTTSRFDHRSVELFDDLFTKVEKEIPFNPFWQMGASLRGAIYNAEHTLQLANGEMAKTIDSFKRRVLFLGTPLGVITLFAKPFRDKFNVIYEVPEVFCEKSLFSRASAELTFPALQYTVSALFAQAMQEAADEAVLA